MHIKKRRKKNSTIIILIEHIEKSIIFFKRKFHVPPNLNITFSLTFYFLPPPKKMLKKWMKEKREKIIKEKNSFLLARSITFQFSLLSFLFPLLFFPFSFTSPLSLLQCPLRPPLAVTRGNLEH